MSNNILRRAEVIVIQVQNMSTAIFKSHFYSLIITHTLFTLHIVSLIFKYIRMTVCFWQTYSIIFCRFVINADATYKTYDL